jgi:hypothetical protein
METWDLTDELREKFKPIVKNYISLIESDEVGNEHRQGIDLTNQGISPMQLKELLEELGYKYDDYSSNGWQHDFWWNMSNSNYERYAKKLCICGCGMTFNLALRSDVD